MSDSRSPANNDWLDAPNWRSSDARGELQPISNLTQALESALMRLGEAIGAAQGASFERVRAFLTGSGKAAFQTMAGQLDDFRLITFLERMRPVADEDRRALILDLFNRKEAGSQPESSSLEALARRELLRRMLSNGRIRALRRACQKASVKQKGERA